MKIYVSHSTNYNYMNELYLPIRNSNINKIHQFILPHEKSEKLFNSKKLFINGCDLVLAEVSYSSIGVGIELGWANMRGIRIICLYKKDVKVSKSLKAVSSVFIKYKDKNDLIDKIEKNL